MLGLKPSIFWLSAGCLLVVLMEKPLLKSTVVGWLLNSLNLPCPYNPREESESTDDSSILNESFIDGLKGPAAIFITY